MITSHFCEDSFIYLKSNNWIFMSYPYYIVESTGQCEVGPGHPL